MSIRGNIKKILFPHIIKHIVISLCGASIFFICYLLFDLISLLIKEIHDDINNQNHNNNTDKHDSTIKSGKVLYYFRNFFMLILFILMQLFGLIGALKRNKNILITFICCLLVSFIMMIIDYITNTGYLSLGIFFLIQSLFTYLLILIDHYNYQYNSNNNSSNIHYIPMPKDNDTIIQQQSSSSRSTSFSFTDNNNRF